MKITTNLLFIASLYLPVKAYLKKVKIMLIFYSPLQNPNMYHIPISNNLLLMFHYIFASNMMTKQFKQNAVLKISLHLCGLPLLILLADYL